MARVLIAIPTDGGVHEMTAATAAKLAQHRDIDFVVATGRPADYIRNTLISRFRLMPGFTHLLFLDSDVVPPSDCVQRLLAVDAPIAAGVYPVLMASGMRWALANRDADRRYRLLERLPSMTESFEVDAGGAGCLLVHRDVFDKIDWPWFRWVEHHDGSQVSEDIHFFKKANKARFRVTVDPMVMCHHFKMVNLTPVMLKLQKIER